MLLRIHLEQLYSSVSNTSFISALAALQPEPSAVRRRLDGPHLLPGSQPSGQNRVKPVRVRFCYRSILHFKPTLIFLILFVNVV